MAALKEIAGHKYNSWMVLHRAPSSPNGKANWLCRCACGIERVVSSSNLVRGLSTSCGCSVDRKPRPNAGDRFGSLTVISVAFVSKKKMHWNCRCDCGALSTPTTSALHSGNSQSCGCQRIPATIVACTSHGHASGGQITPEYRAWTKMKERCGDPNNIRFDRYGGRGIKVCDQWKDDFLAFFMHVGPKPSPDMSLDRYPDPDGDYEPGNVRWATDLEQAQNKSRLAA